ncbi:hypothetical protein HG530_001021 [Fusarium avenaceum]|nr:hypothetical protein HG530_001021 [Fusarium avenaceum]
MRNRIANDNTICDHSAKRKHPLRNADGDQPRLPKAVLDCPLEVARPTELAVDDNKTDRPVDYNCKTDQQQDAADETSLAHGVWLADDTRADDRVGHVHEG